MTCQLEWLQFGADIVALAIAAWLTARGPDLPRMRRAMRTVRIGLRAHH